MSAALQMKDAPELEKTLGKSYANFAAICDYLDCFYNTETKYGGKSNYGLFSIMHKQAGRSVCTLYLKEGYFTLLVVLGKKEQQAFETADFRVCEKIQAVYDCAHPNNDGKWLFIDICDEDLSDIKHLLALKRKPDKASITLCGCKCGQCAAFIKNIKKNDRRPELSALWHKALDADIPPDAITCPGCRSAKKDALFDTGCPVRSCVQKKGLAHCGDCGEFPCKIFDERDTARFIRAKEREGVTFDEKERALLAAYDNRKRICAYKQLNDL
jgi:hypothetical protein